MNRSSKVNTIKTAAAPGRKRVIDSSTLFGNEPEVLILHGDQTYKLKITRQDKLILTK